MFHFQNYCQSVVPLEVCGELAVVMEVWQEWERSTQCIEGEWCSAHVLAEDTAPLASYGLTCPTGRVPGGASLPPSASVATLLFIILFLGASEEWKNLFQHRPPRGLSQSRTCLLREIVLGVYRVAQQPSWYGQLLSLPVSVLARKIL